MGTARTFVWIDDEAKVVAHFSLGPHEIRRDSVSQKLGRGSPAIIPSSLVARLALHRQHRGRGLGAQLLTDAVSRAVDAIRVAGGRFIVIDALHAHAARVYRHHDFEPSLTKPFRPLMRPPTQPHRPASSGRGAAPSLDARLAVETGWARQGSNLRPRDYESWSSGVSGCRHVL